MLPFSQLISLIACGKYSDGSFLTATCFVSSSDEYFPGNTSLLLKPFPYDWLWSWLISSFRVLNSLLGTMFCFLLRSSKHLRLLFISGINCSWIECVCLLRRDLFKLWGHNGLTCCFQCFYKDVVHPAPTHHIISEKEFHQTSPVFWKSLKINNFILSPVWVKVKFGKPKFCHTNWTR